MKLLSFSFCLILALINASCSSNNNPSSHTEAESIDSFESALPHGKALNKEELSDEDKIKLAQANGISAKLLTFDSLKVLIEEDSSGLIIYNFWNLDCQNCKAVIEMLKSIQNENLYDIDFKTVNVNINSLFPDMVNSYIREKEIVDPVYTIEMDSIFNWTADIQNGWEGQLPAILIVNKRDGLKLFYQQSFTTEELQTILLPLTF